MADLADVLRSGLADRYVVDREIGRGGMASVLLARDLRHDRPVAIKVIHPDVAAVIGGERFRREIRLTARLAHPGILAVLDSGECPTSDGDSVLWYAMPYVEGASLRARLTRERQLPVDEAISIARDVAGALDHAHRHGIVHRDVKPENILLQDGRPVLADFGIARAVDAAVGQRLTETGVTVGTPAYMSPEQALGEPEIDARSDIYALGCVLYEMLAGEPPFTGPTAQAIVARMLSAPPPALTPTRPLAAAVEPVVLKALSRTPADRYATAHDMAAALEAGASATRASLGARPGPRSSRRIRIAVGGAALALAFIVGVVVWRDRGGRSAAAPSARGTARLVVLPFRTTGDSARAYFTAGMTRALRTRLATIGGIDVIAGTSAEAVDESADPATRARELGAQYALTGTVAWDSVGGGRIRVQPELVSAADGRVALSWPEPVKASTRDVLDVERQITQQIARALDVTVAASVRARLGAGASGNPAAYEMMLRAETAADNAERRETLLRAVALDTLFGSAWARLGSDAATGYLESRDRNQAAAAGTYSLKALATAPDLAQSHLARGLYHRSVTMKPDSALFHLTRARELAPGDAEVLHFLASGYQVAGRFEEALTEARRGAALDPKNPSALGRVARTLAWLRRPEDAWDSHARVRALAPTTIPAFSWIDGAIIRLSQGDLKAARAAIASVPLPNRQAAIRYVFTPLLLPQVVDDSLVADACDHGEQSSVRAAPWSRHLICAEAARRAGQTGRARTHADSAARQMRADLARDRTAYAPSPQYAWALLVAGDTSEALVQADAALRWRPMEQDAFFGVLNTLWYLHVVALAGDADRAARVLTPLLTKPSPMTVAWLRADPSFDPLRSDARFAALLARPDVR